MHHKFLQSLTIPPAHFDALQVGSIHMLAYVIYGDSLLLNPYAIRL